MNLVGKILTVLIFVMSLVFMSFAVAVYATHKNWKEVVTKPDTGLSDQLKKIKSRNQELKDQQTSLEREMAAERSAGEQRLAQLQSQYNLSAQQLKQAQLQEADLKKDVRDAVAAMNATETRLLALDGELKAIRAKLAQAEQDKDTSVNEVIRLTDDLHQVVNELARLRDRQVALAGELANAKEVLQKFSLKPEPELYRGQPDIVDGLVLAVPGRDLVEISIGADDGLLAGHKLEVYRAGGAGNTYVGRIEVVETHPDRAVCRPVAGYQQSPIQRGDRVASRINRQ
ncbi:MAG: hypothetical protein JXB62_12700 [Pirellulales bacterium]|nr:hypothetical protein [Pirellulales bacterium]